MKITLFAVSTIILILNVPNLTNKAKAQDCWFGIKAGLSIPDLKGGNTPQSTGYKSRTGPDFGLLAYKNLSEHFALQAELSYVSQGGVKKGVQSLDPTMLPGISVPPGVALYARFKNKAIMNYLEVPLLQNTRSRYLKRTCCTSMPVLTSDIFLMQKQKQAERARYSLISQVRL